jgi:uncharacterized protein involved in exopolysaccharide biosynthesis
MVALNMQAVQRTENQLLEIQRQLQSIEESRILLTAQLAQVDKMAPTILPDGQAVLSPESQIKALETRLSMLEGQYSQNHPDVLRTRRELQAMREQTGITADLSDTAAALTAARAELAKARKTYTAGHPEVQRLERTVASLESKALEERDQADALVRPDNPAYIQISSQLEGLQADENSLREQARVLGERLDEYERNMLKSPKVEQELFALQRELQTATQRYIAIRDRQFGAEMGEALESQSKGERFVLVEPPNLPLEPSSPNRAALILLLLILSPAIGIGVVQLKEGMDNAVWASKDLEILQGAPPIAEIPLILTAKDQAHQQRVRRLAIAGVPAAVVLMMVVIHFAYRPLDVLWFSAMRQLGI